MKTQQQLFMKALCRGLVSLVCILTLAGCNSDVFIDSEPEVSESRLEIPDGGEASFTFPTGSLVSVNVYFDDKFDCVKYLPSGEEFARYKQVSQMTLYDTSSSQPFITRLTASNPDADLEITGSAKGEITVKSISNIRGEAVTGRIVITYGYYEATVTFEIASSVDGKPRLEARKLVYKGQVTYDAHETGSKFTVNNYGTAENTQHFSPADFCKMMIYFQKISVVDYEIDYGDITTEIPTWDPASMRPAFLGEKALLRIGTEQRPAPDYVLPEGDSFTKKFDLTAPPMMSAVLQFTQVEVLMTSYATLIAVNPISGREYEIDIRVDVLQPIKYSYTINTSPLPEK